MPQLQHEFCTVSGCGRPHKCRGYCQTHYMQWKRGEPVVAEIKVRDRTPLEHCSESGCLEPVKAKGLCKMHYARLLRHGHTRYQDRTKPPRPCSVVGCENWYYADGLCHQHYARKRRLHDKYGLTLEQEAVMLSAQGGVCVICGGKPRSVNGPSGKITDFHVDHDHATDKVRGLLCSNCNRGLGMFEDSPERLRAAADYIEKHRT